MLICPKCRNEYRDGITHCADCKCELVSEITFTDEVVLIYGDEPKLVEVNQYLQYSGLQGSSIKQDPEDGRMAIFVRKKDLEKAQKYAGTFLQQEQLRAVREMEEQQEEAAKLAEENKPRWVGENTAGTPKPAPQAQPKVQVPPSVYRDKAEKAAEERSSAYALLIVGFAGIALLVLSYLDIFPIKVASSNRTMLTVVMGAMFVLFIIMGFVSFSRSKKFKEVAKGEGSLRDEMKTWLKENVDSKVMDERLELSRVPEEEWYFRRTALLKMILNHQFMNLDQNFLDHFIDDIYDDVFPS